MNEFKLEATFKNLDLGENYADTKYSLKSLKEKIDELHGLKKDDLFIHEYFAKIRNNIDIEREVVKLKVDRHYLELIDEVNRIEADCLKRSTAIKNAIEVKVFDDKLNLFKTDFDQLKIDFRSWEKIRKESTLEYAILDKTITDFKSDLLMSKKYAFESNDTSFREALSTAKIVTENLWPQKSIFMVDLESID